MYRQRNIEALSCNHCYSGKARSITQLVCVCVCVVCVCVVCGVCVVCACVCVCLCVQYLSLVWIYLDFGCWAW